eukprot:13819600-Alexandrium_andersonii.AAC.1
MAWPAQARAPSQASCRPGSGLPRTACADWFFLARRDRFGGLPLPTRQVPCHVPHACPICGRAGGVEA